MRIEQLEALQIKAINQMIAEKLDIRDFNIFNQTIEWDFFLMKNSEKKDP